MAVPRFTPSQTPGRLWRRRRRVNLPLEGESGVGAEREMMEKPFAEPIEALYVCCSHHLGRKSAVPRTRKGKSRVTSLQMKPRKIQN